MKYERELQSRVWGIYEDRDRALERYGDDLIDELNEWDEEELESAWNGDDEYEGYLKENISIELNDEYTEEEIKTVYNRIEEYFDL
jgi:predicted ribosome quality control (RQC) complex YloA/Tae2 family protein